jgi:hypothetical protein
MAVIPIPIQCTYWFQDHTTFYVDRKGFVLFAVVSFPTSEQVFYLAKNTGDGGMAAQIEFDLSNHMDLLEGYQWQGKLPERVTLSVARASAFKLFGKMRELAGYMSFVTRPTS